ncbi:Uncharacterized conserved protein UCP032146 [Rhodomicrobium vannielii ATCC 17100]|uniref:UPF0262 protein Rvan_0547 n=2 Tax=Rhodomicrobium TaxID=1068 RepID=E3HYT7_RHOVT|nr:MULTISPECIES: UPF0262 family protein [Rhodomicrobium]ADP69828.1 Uncharacterized conserved protein UCP032146 [Rhodomicrobium vannielii ATCC 17100]KAI94348.1 hypothetical protein T281_11510 [Rhodomicrobium udaipurense JA643]MBJ7543394.1 UPF0262 family protein [Rhodomicrobium udaipurense]
MPERTEVDPSARLIEVNIDEASMGANALEVEHERRVAIFDLLEENAFELIAGPAGPYKLDIAMIEQKLVLAVRTNGAAEADATFILSLNPFRRVVKDYFLICESYFEAIKTAPPSRIEALDMARRALHDDGSQLLQERLEGKVRMDTATSRRLFTLLCALHWRG